MNLAEEAFKELYLDQYEDREFIITYSGKFKKLNANVKYNQTKIHFSLSKDWLEYSEDIRKGLIQNLLIKVFKHEYTKTLELDLYEKFLNNLGRYAKVDNNDPILEESYNRINKKYFSDSMDKPNLVWGQDAFRKLGHYEYASNTILVSSIFKKEPELLDYIMYHEVLHKVLKFKQSGTKNYHHTAEFRRKEKEFENSDLMEKRIKEIIASRQRKKKTTGSTPFIRRLSSFF